MMRSCVMGGVEKCEFGGEWNLGGGCF